jgi:phosphatidylserine/phosphatidylglycerophosphate/cardiolipin synthase-like enzyme
LIAALIVVLGSLATGCTSVDDGAARVGTTGGQVPAPVSAPTVIQPASTGLTVAVEPTDGDQVVDQLLAGATRSVDLTIYELADPAVESLLAADRRRGVTVRVLLDRAGAGGTVNRAAASWLAAAGVSVRWGPAGILLHQKTVTVDDRASAVMTGNLVASEPDTRDFVIVDRTPAAVASIESVFLRDWEGDPPGPVAGVAGLVWSPGAGPTLLGLIGSARHSVAVENEEMDDPAVEEALMAAARRGIRVTVTMTADPAWRAALDRLASAGVRVTLHPDATGTLYLHAKAVVVDDATTMVGSQNLSWAGLDENRELGVVTDQPSVVDAVASTLTADTASGVPFRPAA